MRFSDEHSLINEHTWYGMENVSAHAWQKRLNGLGNWITAQMLFCQASGGTFFFFFFGMIILVEICCLVQGILENKNGNLPAKKKINKIKPYNRRLHCFIICLCKLKLSLKIVESIPVFCPLFFPVFFSISPSADQ